MFGFFTRYLEHEITMQAGATKEVKVCDCFIYFWLPEASGGVGRARALALRFVADGVPMVVLVIVLAGKSRRYP
jgi:hypothetical protein